MIKGLCELYQDCKFTFNYLFCVCVCVCVCVHARALVKETCNKLILVIGVKSVENAQRIVVFRAMTPYKSVTLLLQPSESLPESTVS